jgi:N-acetylmuramoyl-L-alanine amidase
LFIGRYNYLKKAWKPLFICFIAALSLFCIFEQKDMAQGRGIGDEQLLARAVNGEARGESYEGQVAVAAVIINRTRSPKFPKTIAGVIYQPGAFTAVSDGQINVPIDENSTVVKAARDALNGWDPTNGCLYYWNPATATSKWIWSRTIVKKIGKHNFGK